MRKLKKMLYYCRGCKNDRHNGYDADGITECSALEASRIVIKMYDFGGHRKPRRVRQLDCYKG